MTFQVEDYISHLQQISEDQKTSIQIQKKEIEMARKDSEAISKLIRDALFTDDSKNVEDSKNVVDQVEDMVTGFKNLKNNLEQLKIEKEILSETLSEHSSSFQKERKITSLLDQYENIDIVLKNKEPVEKVQILMDLTRKQMDELSEFKNFQNQLFDLFNMEEEEVSNTNIINTAIKQQVLYKNFHKNMISFHNLFLQLSLSINPNKGGIRAENLKTALEELTKHLKIGEQFDDNLNSEEIITHLQVIEECLKTHIEITAIIDSIDIPYESSNLSMAEKLERYMEHIDKQSQEFHKFTTEFSKLVCSFDFKQGCGIVNDVNTLEENNFSLNESIKALRIELQKIKDLKSVLSEISNLIFDYDDDDDDDNNAIHSNGLPSDLPIHLKELIENYKHSEQKEKAMLDKISKEIETFDLPAFNLGTLSVIEKIQAVQVYMTQLQAQQKKASNFLYKLQSENIFQQDPSKEMNFESVTNYFASMNKKLDDISLLLLNNVNSHTNVDDNNNNNNNKNNNNNNNNGDINKNSCIISNHILLILENIHNSLEENRNLKSDYEKMQNIILKSNTPLVAFPENEFSLENFAAEFIELRKRDVFLQRIIHWTAGSQEQSFLTDDNEIEGQSMLIDLLNGYQTVQESLIAGNSELMSTTDEYVCLIKKLFKERKMLNSVFVHISQMSENLDFSQDVDFENVGEILTSFISNFTDLKKRNLTLHQDIESTQENLSRVQNELDDLKQQNSQLCEITESMKPELHQQQIETKNKINECKMLEDELQSNRSEIKNIKDRYKDLVNEYQKLEKESIEDHQRLTTENNLLIENKVSECENYENEISCLSNQLVTLEDELKLLRNVHQQVSEKAKYLAQEVRRMKKDKQKEDDDHQKNLDQINSELEGNNLETI